MKIHELNEIVKGKGFKVFDDAEYDWWYLC